VGLTNAILVGETGSPPSTANLGIWLFSVIIGDNFFEKIQFFFELILSYWGIKRESRKVPVHSTSVINDEEKNGPRRLINLID
jgi:hypothetical protein